MEIGEDIIMGPSQKDNAPHLPPNNILRDSFILAEATF
jgi:hypothetical protein